MNTMKIVLLMAFLTLLVVGVGGAIGGQRGAVMAFALAGVMNFVTYFWSDKMVLAMYGAKEVSEAEAPELHRMIDDSLSSLPRRDFDYVWLIDAPPYSPATVADMKPVWRGPGSILYQTRP